MLARALWLTALLTGSISFASAHDVQSDQLRVAHPFATPTPPGVVNGAAYLDITAYAASAILVGAQTPVSKSVELHYMQMEGDMMKMRHVSAIEIAKDETLTMRPGGGYHLMLMGLHQPLVEGDRFPITLEFAQQDDIEIEIWVQSALEGSADADRHHQH
ncbi:copper chaperone PCu(A)C [Vreelandella andesensis]|uniref:Copper chaperone PCu(A)C n=1 Tax=Vreelandella andesensis TaxID=447567 RepID=A0A433KL56_9GAMM|nr:copper chaperone PCu(A)C [Halomonas andesensis]RUR30200.1 copper chaperone PCu(A)C [Halomonas andesensis]